MPELPEVETVVRSLSPIVLGQRFKKVVIKNPSLRYKLDEEIINLQLNGQKINQIERIAKYIVCKLSSGKSLIIHLGMSGRLLDFQHISNLNDKMQKHNHVEFSFENDQKIIYNDPRRFGFIKVINDIDRYFKNIGRDPFTLKEDEIYDFCKKSKKEIKDLLLDQSIIAGIGNIYASEILFYSKIHPKKISNKLTKMESDKLLFYIKKVLNDAIEKGGSSLKDYVTANGTKGSFQNHFAVYGKQNQKCPNCSCNSMILKIVQKQRATFFCNFKQKLN